MEVANTYIVNDNGKIIPLYVSFDVKWFIPSHNVGQLREITGAEARELLQKNKPKG